MERSQDFINIFQNNKLITKELYEFLLNGGFFNQVASTRFHGDYVGGLYDHSKNVMTSLVKLTEKNDLKWERVESPYIIGMFHDLCKIDNYTINDDGSIIYNKEKKILGHGDRSVKLLSEFIQLTEEEKLCITYHMGAYETDKWNDYDKAIKKYPNVLWTHMADMIASKIMEKGSKENEENTTKNMRN